VRTSLCARDHPLGSGEKVYFQNFETTMHRLSATTMLWKDQCVMCPVKQDTMLEAKYAPVRLHISHLGPDLSINDGVQVNHGSMSY
jgi:hypothetical protein